MHPLRLPSLASAMISLCAVVGGACMLTSRGELEEFPPSDASVAPEAFESEDSPWVEAAMDLGGDVPTAIEADAALDRGPDLDDAAEDGPQDEPGDPCAALALSYGFESGPQEFTHAPTSGIASDDPWTLGTPASVVCHSGTQCWNTASAGTYTSCQTAWLLSPPIDLSACASSAAALTLSFWHYYRFEPLTYNQWPDGGLVQLSPDDGVTWNEAVPDPAYQGIINGGYGSPCNCTPVPAVAGHNGWSDVIPGGTWLQVKVPIDAAHRATKFRFRFLFGADCGTEDLGWCIDDVAISPL